MFIKFIENLGYIISYIEKDRGIRPSHWTDLPEGYGVVYTLNKVFQDPNPEEEPDERVFIFKEKEKEKKLTPEEKEFWDSILCLAEQSLEPPHPRIYKTMIVKKNSKPYIDYDTSGWDIPENYCFLMPYLSCFGPDDPELF